MTTAYDEGQLTRTSTPGPRLYYICARPTAPPAAVVGLLHGYADYGKRYAHVLEAWAARGIATVALDMRGHGRAEGARGFCDRFAEYDDDATELRQLVAKHAPDAPAFLFGHSFGGLVAASFAIAHPSPWRAPHLDRAVLRLGPRRAESRKVVVGKIASRVAPGLGVPSGLHGADLTHDADRARAYDEDPLVFKKATARWFTETEGAQALALARAPSLALPLLVVMGTADRVAKVAAAKRFFDAAGSADKTWDAREGLFHEVLNEPEWRSIADRIADWVLAHAK